MWSRNQRSCHLMAAYAISSFPPNLVYISFLKLWHDNMENWKYKVRQFIIKLLRSVTEVYYKVCQVLQSATVITKWDVTDEECE